MDQRKLAAVFLMSLLYREMAAGGHDDLDLVLRDLVSEPDRSMSHRDLGLTERQAQVLALVAEGKPNKIICRELGLAVATVKIHVTAILKALRVTNRTQAVIAVSKLGLRLPAP